MVFFDPGWSALLGATLGLVLGSYLATLLIRWPLAAQGRHVRRSHCDQCHRQLAWFELVPLASFILQRGRCRHCAAPISSLHFSVELACGAAGAACFAAGMPWLALMIWLAIGLAVFDARYLALPDPIVAAFAISAATAPAWDETTTMAMRIAGGAIGFAVLWSVAGLYRRMRGRTGLGGGDPKLFGAIGLWTGALGLPTVMLAACAIGLSHAVIKVRAGADPRSVQLPLGTYLMIATILLAGVKMMLGAGLRTM